MVENRGISLFRDNALYLLAAVGLVLLDLAATLLSSIEGLNTGAASVLLNVGYYVLFLGAPVLLYAVRRQDGLDTLRMLPLPLSRALLIALLAASALMLVSLVSMWFLALVEATGKWRCCREFLRNSCSAALCCAPGKSAAGPMPWWSQRCCSPRCTARCWACLRN